MQADIESTPESIELAPAGIEPAPGESGIESAATGDPARTPHSADEMDAVIKRLKRAQGQLGGIIKMIEDGRDCKAIVIQISAVGKAVDRAGFAVIAANMRECLTSDEPAYSQEEMEKMFLSLA